MNSLRRFIKETHVTHGELLIQDDPGMMDITAEEFEGTIEGDMLATMLTESDNNLVMCESISCGDFVEADRLYKALKAENVTNMKESIQRLYSEGL